MTVKTWIDEFYPKPATDTTPGEALQHSLTKWQGLRPENLKKHNVRVSAFADVVGIDLNDQRGSLAINGRTCALCEHFLSHNDEHMDRCEPCPLSIARGNTPCDFERDDEEFAPWYAFRTDESNPNTPEPMIYWLEKALKMQSK
jgi:hypothetical protein